MEGQRVGAKKRSSDTIGRVHVVNPVAGDIYFLRILLHHDHCKGKSSFDDLRTVGGVLMDQALTEVAATKMPSATRELFVTILRFCMPSNPQELFDRHHIEWADDFVVEAQKRSLILSKSQMRT